MLHDMMDVKLAQAHHVLNNRPVPDFAMCEECETYHLLVFEHKKCPQNFKIMFPTKREALLELEECQRKGRPEKRVYHCKEYCGAWHLTSVEAL
jgi:hypothetical protein